MFHVSILELVFLTLACATAGTMRLVPSLSRWSLGVFCGAALAVALTPADPLSTFTMFGVGMVMLAIGQPGRVKT